MIDIFIHLVRQIAMLTLLAVFIEMLLPKGDMQRFARMVMGLLLLVIILNPLLSVFDTALPTVLEDPNGYDAEVTAVLQQGEALASSWQQQELAHFQEDLQKQIATTVSYLPGVERVEVQSDVVLHEKDGYQQLISLHLQIVYKKEATEKITISELKQYLSGLYGIGTEKIAVEEVEEIAQ